MTSDAMKARMDSLDSVRPLSVDVWKTLQKSLVVPYHPDRNRKEEDEEWAALAEAVTKMANGLIDEYKKKIKK